MVSSLADGAVHVLTPNWPLNNSGLISESS